MREHLTREISELLSFNPQICYTVWTRANVNDGPGKGLSRSVFSTIKSVEKGGRQHLVERGESCPVPPDALDLSQCLLECSP